MDRIGEALFAVGFVGFLVCWGIGWNEQGRVLGDPQFKHPTAQRPAPIEMKGDTFFVEPAYAVRFRVAEYLFVVFWTTAAAGGLLRNRGKIAEWWNTRKVGK